MERISFYEQIEKNKRDSIFLVILVFIFLLALFYVISLIFAPELSAIFIIFAFIIAISYIFISYNYGDEIVLAATDAKPANEREHAYLINTVEGLSIAAGIPKPKVYVIESDEMNAFATGKDPAHSSIAVTTALLKNLNRMELEGVIGHEISHIKNYDIRFATLVAVLVGLVAIVSHMLLRSYRFGFRRERGERGAGLILIIGLILAIFAPIATRLVQAAISRRREFLADADAAKLTRYPEGLASALEKIMKMNMGKSMNVSEAVSHLFFVDPNRSPLDALFATHPPIQERIRILRAM
ncbi:MAG: M48 family metallopeptidase [Candidatus Parvarchaeota archaeon]|nr:M48 family metallopeptidase [Candidatus Jingweiarchaeum tengchongense]MCW1297709.1 M48 family metallopeptidase [Candidatus Jingweiarchaeum tengchongense]MCW1299720.1 M48 family metallopeptidase [Candidatus Jingweiarchaeum tengchongense]MCW1304312.1 M48 family metallopeptidase [Candidatus Jingweiarchaeum tengchongense]MCW1305705.1 M48 family metallopeptidase [Candidatus Jingweiarchaeum tengchongense]